MHKQGNQCERGISFVKSYMNAYDEHMEISWSEVARAAIKEKLAQLRLLKAIVAKSKLTQSDADALARKITGSLHKRYGTGS